MFNLVRLTNTENKEIILNISKIHCVVDNEDETVSVYTGYGCVTNVKISMEDFEKVINLVINK